MRQATEIWRFQVALDESCALGVAFTELSESPDAKPCEIVTIAQDGAEGLVFEECRYGAATVVVNAYQERGSQNQTGEHGRVVRVKVTILVEALENGLWAVDFFLRGKEGSWMPLESVEKHGYSKLRIFAWGDKLPAENAGWWARLRRSNRFDLNQTDPALSDAL